MLKIYENLENLWDSIQINSQQFYQKSMQDKRTKFIIDVFRRVHNSSSEAPSNTLMQDIVENRKIWPKYKRNQIFFIEKLKIYKIRLCVQKNIKKYKSIHIANGKMCPFFTILFLFIHVFTHNRVQWHNSKLKQVKMNSSPSQDFTCKKILSKIK